MDERKHDKDKSLAESPTQDNTKDNENLVQNWSLTFTEYNQYETPSRAEVHNQNVENRTEPKRETFENANVDEIESVSVGLTSNQNKQRVASEKDDNVVTIAKQTDSSKTEGEHVKNSDSIETKGKREPVKEITTTREASEKLINSVQNSETGVNKVSDVKQDKRKLVSETAKQEIEILNSNKNKDESKYTEPIDKYNVLPPIIKAGPANGSYNKLKANSIPNQSEKTQASSEDASSSVKGPSNTPASVNGGSKVQHIYVRFPGQRTGQMVL